jgi:hypothetical protein
MAHWWHTARKTPAQGAPLTTPKEAESRPLFARTAPPVRHLLEKITVVVCFQSLVE